MESIKIHGIFHPQVKLSGFLASYFDETQHFARKIKKRIYSIILIAERSETTNGMKYESLI